MIKFITNFLNSILSYFSPYLLSNRCNPEAQKQKVNENKNKKPKKRIAYQGREYVKTVSLGMIEQYPLQMISI